VLFAVCISNYSFFSLVFSCFISFSMSSFLYWLCFSSRNVVLPVVVAIVVPVVVVINGRLLGGGGCVRARTKREKREKVRRRRKDRKPRKKEKAFTEPL